VIYLEGFGLRDVARRLPVTPDTLFGIGSCTKAFTAMAAVMSADDGKLSECIARRASASPGPRAPPGKRSSPAASSGRWECAPAARRWRPYGRLLTSPSAISGRAGGRRKKQLAANGDRRRRQLWARLGARRGARSPLHRARRRRGGPRRARLAEPGSASRL